MTLGRYPEVTLARARERHVEARRQLSEGLDPMSIRKEEKAVARIASEYSFANIASIWLERWSDGKTARHADTTRRRLDVNVLPTLGPMAISDIEARHIVGMVQAVQGRGVRDLAKRAFETTG